ncbi:hypothetical protein FA09DRAFT_332814 [Tilletiopsis washingtonensis]|uniref:Uncharacterized protein n=1 Tax=Tilletiopsis washingtonensis TaxID=58919 RepID=A0A316Z3C8_9BASI|nr:hypothetical protein FA09DRAFT_332814 [Tilletiopsis washingtonensis]PWN94693.1 hypothetical protein FA09DRAFT_332814 [Tilletiopsis washingtonensis]
MQAAHGTPGEASLWYTARRHGAARGQLELAAGLAHLARPNIPRALLSQRARPDANIEAHLPLRARAAAVGGLDVRDCRSTSRRGARSRVQRSRRQARSGARRDAAWRARASGAHVRSVVDPLLAPTVRGRSRPRRARPAAAGTAPLQHEMPPGPSHATQRGETWASSSWPTNALLLRSRALQHLRQLAASACAL